jgi:hypothetical protein
MVKTFVSLERNSFLLLLLSFLDCMSTQNTETLRKGFSYNFVLEIFVFCSQLFVRKKGLLAKCFQIRNHKKIVSIFELLAIRCPLYPDMNGFRS